MADGDEKFLEGMPKQCFCDDISKLSQDQISTNLAMVQSKMAAKIAEEKMKAAEAEAKKIADEQERQRKLQADRIAAKECAAKRVMDELIAKDAAEDAAAAKEQKARDKANKEE